MTFNRPALAPFALVFSFALSAPACVIGEPLAGDDASVDDDELGEIAAATPILPDRLLADGDIEGGVEITTAQVQRFLERRGSALASFSEGGDSAARIIVAAGRADGISPLYLLARIETESGLVSSGTLAHIGSATGCACPDGQACDPSLAGFATQVRCAAGLMRGYLDDLDTGGATISGWRVGVPRSTLDPCRVTPANRATAALYTYTPWVGAWARGCGTPQWGGSSLVALLHRDFAGDFPERNTSCPFGEGLYCGQNGVAGDPDTLYLCRGGGLLVAERCAAGCAAQDPGTDDHCTP